MRNVRNAIATVIMITAAGALAACETLPYRLPGAKTAELPPDKGLVLFSADTVGDTPVRRIQYSDAIQRVDYALYKGQGAQAEFVYMEIPYNQQVAFNFPFTIRDKVEAWTFSKGQATEWEDAVLMNTKLGLVFYRPYRLTALNRRCFGMSGEWDVADIDPEMRFTRIMFGYYCAPPGKAMSPERTVSLLDRIGLRGITQRSPGYADSLRNFYRDVVDNFAGPEGNARATGLARAGDGSGPAGISEFPFEYGERYSRLEGGSLTD